MRDLAAIFHEAYSAALEDLHSRLLRNFAPSACGVARLRLKVPAASRFARGLPSLAAVLHKKRRLAVGLLVLSALMICHPAWAGKANEDRCARRPRLSQSLHKVMGQAQKLMDSDSVKADQLLTRYAQKHPSAKHFKFSFLRGVIAYQGKKPAQAQVHFAKAVKLRPCYVPALRNLAAVTYELGNPAGAAALMLRANKNSDKPRPQCLYQAALFFLAANQPAQALPLLTSLTAGPKVKAPWLKALVRTYMDLKRYIEAQAALARLLRESPGDAGLWRLSARLCMDRSSYAKAAADLEVAYRLSPPVAGQWRNLAGLYRMAGVPLKAARYYNLAFGPHAKAKDFDLLAGVFLEGNYIEQALEAALAAVNAAPSSKRWRLAAQIYMMDKCYKKAIHAFSQAARLSPGNARLKLMAGYCALQMEDYQQALGHLSQAAARAKPKSKEASEAIKTLKSIRQYLEAEKNEESHG